MTKFHVTDSGDKVCVAESQATCRAKFNGAAGNVPHFETREEARAFFERALGESESTVPPVKKRSSLRLVGQADEGVSPSTRYDGIDLNDQDQVYDYVRRTAVLNPREVIGMIRERNWSTPELENILDAAPDLPLVANEMTTADHPGMTPKLRRRAYKQLTRSLPGGRVPASTVTGLGSRMSEVLPDVKRSDLPVVAQHTTDERALKHITGSLAFGGEQADSEEIALALYKNPASTDAIRKSLADAGQYETVERLHKLDEVARKTNDPQLSGLISHRTSESVPSGKVDIKFDVDKVREAGLTSKDVMVMMEHRNGMRLFDASYDEKTGVFGGYSYRG